jgi:LPS-assembly protein
LALAVAVVLSAAPIAVAADERTRSRLPGGIEVEADGFQETEDGKLVLWGAVTLIWRDSRFQADRIVMTDRRFIEAEGNVLVVWGGNRLSGARMSYDLELDTGLIEDVKGEIEPEFIIRAKRVMKVGADRLRLESATVTTCTQPVPYWSFSVSSANIRLNHYAHLKNMRFKAGKAPVFYLPYMAWPVKKDRSVGLLFPDFGTTENRGTVFAVPLFIPIGRSADLTLVGEYYTKAGLGGGGDFRYIPNQNGTINLSGFYIDDDAAGPSVCSQPPCARWRVSYKQTQQFRNGFRMVADINQVSDFDYFSDFERDIRLVSSPSVLGRLEFSRNGKWTSVNIRDFRREQLVFALDAQGVPVRDVFVQQTLPEIEFRGRDRRLGKSPFYLSYESSLASIQQFGPTIDADYLRFDLFPRVSVPLSKLSWLEVNPRFDYRMTYWTQSQVPDQDLSNVQVVDEKVVRGIGAAGIDIVGPKVSRIYRRGDGKTAFKHLFELRATYGFRESFDDSREVILYDEVDLTAPENFVTYGIRTLLFAKRPRAESSAQLGSGESILWPSGDSTSADQVEPFPADPRLAPGPPKLSAGPTEPLEIASLELSQTRSLDEILLCADRDGDSIVERTSKASPIQLTGRFNPSTATSLDLRASYHPIYKQIQNVTFSGSARGRVARVGFSLVHNSGEACSVSGTQFFPVVNRDNTQLALMTGFVLLGGKLRFDVNGSFTSNPGKNPITNKAFTRFPQKRISAEYYTQCCGFLGEYFERDYATSKRRDFRFTVDLRGIGKFLDLHHGQDR